MSDFFSEIPEALKSFSASIEFSENSKNLKKRFKIFEKIFPGFSEVSELFQNLQKLWKYFQNHLNLQRIPEASKIFLDQIWEIFLDFMNFQFFLELMKILKNPENLKFRKR